MSSNPPRTSLRLGLRQAPKANQPFIPDTTPARRSHHHGNTSPQPTTPQLSASPGAPTAAPNPFPTNTHYPPATDGHDARVPMLTREVVTPGNRPGLYLASYDRAKLAKQPDFYDPFFPLKYLEVPKSDHIYKRAHYGLQSGVPDEVDFALYHLVQISNQRWDKFKFEGFPLLAETLMEKAMDVSVLCTGIRWELQYDSRQPVDRANVLNPIYSTRDILERMKRIPVTIPEDSLETSDFNHGLRNVKEATLVLRNMVLLRENAHYVARYAHGLLRDFLVVLLNIPNQPRLNEIKNDALDIAEEVTRFMRTDAEDPLWISLLGFVQSSDRAHVVRGLWALTHFSTELDEPEANRAIDRTPEQTLEQLYYLALLVLDQDIISGALDFWYQYTLRPENVEKLIEMFNISIVFAPRMMALLSYEGHPTISETVLQEEKVAPPPAEIPRVPAELLKELMELSEPERSSRWLRCCFVEDSECEITQIALWQAYQSRFGDPRTPGGGVLPAAEFIKNVSTTFTNAQAQVINGPGATTKFIIKGIRPLETAYTFQGFPYLYCRWADDSTPSKKCQRACATPTELRTHVFEEHMSLTATDTPGRYNLDKAESPIHTCLWDNCTKFRQSGPSADTAMVTGHVSSHLPEDRPEDLEPPSTKRPVLQERIVRTWHYMDTPITEAGEPLGIAYKAALVLRNLARNLPARTAPQYGLSWKDAVFLAHRTKLAEIWESNRSLRRELAELILTLDKDDD